VIGSGVLAVVGADRCRGVILDDVFDRKVAGDKSGHPAGDLLVAIVVVLIALLVWDLVTRKSRSAYAVVRRHSGKLTRSSLQARVDACLAAT
jgi:hypothetical protein